MDLSSLSSITSLGLGGTTQASVLGELTKRSEKTADGNLFDAFLNTAIDNINTTNNYLSDMENEEIKFALGETENTHDLMISIQKASTALQYTVAIRDKLLEAYKEIMQMQI